MSPQPNYTLDDINAEIARRQLARQGSSDTQGSLSSAPVAAGGDIPPWAASRIANSGALPQASTQPTPVGSNSGQPLPEAPGLWERAKNAISGIGNSFETGLSESLPKYALGVNKLLGLQAFEPTKRMFIDPLETRVQAIQAQEAKDTAGAGTGEQIARGAARGAGNLATLPLDIALGAISKAGTLGAQAVEAAPKVASSIPELFRAIPDFALGMGIRKTGEEESIAGLPRGVAEGLAMHSVGELGKDMAVLPRAVTQVGAQGGLGAAMTTADTLEHEGRLPTGTELAVGAGTNAAMALPFVGAPGRMEVNREFTPELRKEFEGQLSGLLKNDQLGMLQDESLQQFRDVVSQLSEIDPDNKTFLNGLLEIDQEQKRRAGYQPEPSQAEAMDAAQAEQPTEQRPYSRAELAGLATGDLNSQDRLMEIADAYGIKDPHRMESVDLIDAIDKAESDRQAEIQRQADIAAQAEQARKDILAAQDEAARIEAIKRFEDATKAIREVPALPIGTQDFELVPYGQRQDVQAGRAMQEEKLAVLNQTPALPQGQGFELVGGPKPYTRDEAQTMERLSQESQAVPDVEPPTVQDMRDFYAGKDKTEGQLVREYQEQRQRGADAEYGKSLSQLWNFLRGRVDAKSISDHYGSAVLENLRSLAPRDIFKSRNNGGTGWDKLEQEAKSQGIIAPDVDLLDVLQANVTNKEQAQRDRINGANDVWQRDMEPTPPQGPHPEENEFVPVNSDGTPRTEGAFYSRSNQPQTPADFAREYDIPATPEFLDAIKQYQEITKSTPEPTKEKQSNFANITPEESVAAEPMSPWSAFPSREDGSRIIAHLGHESANEINKMGFATGESDAVISSKSVDYINARHGDQLSPEDIAYLKKTIEEPTEILPNIGIEGKLYRDRSVLMVRRNGKDFVAIVEVTPGDKENTVWNYWKMNPHNAEKYLAKFREEKARLLQSGGRPDPHVPHDTAEAEVGKPEGLSGSQTEPASLENITPDPGQGKGPDQAAVEPTQLLTGPIGADGKPLFEPLPASSGGGGQGSLADFSPAESSQGAGMQASSQGAGKAAVEKWLAPVRERLAENVNLSVVDRPEEIPVEHQRRLDSIDPNWRDATGDTIDGHSYLFAWNLADRNETRLTVKHEVQHQITTAFFRREAAQEPHKGPAEQRMAQYLRQVIRSKGSDIVEYMRELHGPDFDSQNPLHMLVGASEWLAETRITEPTLYERYKAALISMLREVGTRFDIHWLHDMSISDAELKAFNERLWKDALREGKATDLLDMPDEGGGPGAPRPMSRRQKSVFHRRERFLLVIFPAENRRGL